MNFIRNKLKSNLISAPYRIATGCQSTARTIAIKFFEKVP